MVVRFTNREKSEERSIARRNGSPYLTVILEMPWRVEINLFYERFPGYYDSGRNREQAYFQFWDSIRRYKYLGPDYLQSALDTYFSNKSPTVGDNSRDPAYQDAEKQLFENIDRRYLALQKNM
jgi:hypothetical protein